MIRSYIILLVLITFSLTAASQEKPGGLVTNIINMMSAIRYCQPQRVCEKCRGNNLALVETLSIIQTLMKNQCIELVCQVCKCQKFVSKQSQIPQTLQSEIIQSRMQNTIKSIEYSKEQNNFKEELKFDKEQKIEFDLSFEGGSNFDKENLSDLMTLQEFIELDQSLNFDSHMTPEEQQEQYEEARQFEKHLIEQVEGNLEKLESGQVLIQESEESEELLVPTVFQEYLSFINDEDDSEMISGEQQEQQDEAQQFEKDLIEQIELDQQNQESEELDDPITFLQLSLANDQEFVYPQEQISQSESLDIPQPFQKQIYQIKGQKFAQLRKNNQESQQILEPTIAYEQRFKTKEMRTEFQDPQVIISYPYQEAIYQE